ncbi:dihydrolipoyl dehydrogenase [Nocardia araoensis]|uniref:dihydrolipoyl dehydrogenase n=1 Tax=Nocardia araoensis TaxID=228600 RepID=UPI0002E79C71|nr:dihydrolipoyl dehydrogenase [Nocardia araoensis]
MNATESDVVILGGGSGGYACALRAAQLGLSVTLIEADKIGGACLHRGCVPTKALLRAAEVAETTQSAASFGVRAAYSGIDIAEVHRYKNSIVQRLHTGLHGLLTRKNITIVNGLGTYVGERTVVVENMPYTGKAVVLATGSTPRLLEGLKLSTRVVTSDQALELNFVPQSAIVLGGGVIGVEFASLWRSFGAEVTIVEALPRLLAAEDFWSSKQLEKALHARGVAVRVETRISAAKQVGEQVIVDLADGGTLVGDLLLVAVGRVPNISGFANTEITIENGCIVTDGHLRTTAPDVYAVGDLVAGAQLAHRGFQHGLYVAERIAGLEPIPVPDHLIPKVVYSHPEVASVGLTEEQARARHHEIATATYDLAGNAKSQILKTSGGVKVVRAGTAGPVVGVHMVGDRIGESIGEAQLTVAWEALPADVATFVHAHPTQNESLGEVMLSLAGRSLHIHR